MKNLKYKLTNISSMAHNIAIQTVFSGIIVLVSVIINSFNNYMIEYFSNLPDGGAVFIILFQLVILYCYTKFILIPLPKLLDKYLKWFKENTDVTNT